MSRLTLPLVNSAPEGNVSMSAERFGSLLDLEIGAFDDAAPALHIGIVDRLHLLRRARLWHESKLAEALPHVRLGDRLGDLRVEPRHDRVRSACRHHEA